jgi:hypothetical protein
MERGRLEQVEAFFGPPAEVPPYFYWLYETYEPRLDREAVNRLLASKVVVGKDWPQSYDFIFIDGEHVYEAARSNFETAVALLNPGGVMVFHDVFSHAGVARLMSELKEEYRGKARVVIHQRFKRQCMKIKWLRKRVNWSYIDWSYIDGLGEFRSQV